MKNWSPDLRSLVRERYFRTPDLVVGHRWVCRERLDKKILTGLEEAVRFLATYEGFGIKRTPSQRMWPGAAGSARSALRRWPDAIAIKKTVLIVTSLNEASARGSKGAFARASNTQGRLHVGRNFRAGGRSKKKRAPNQSETVPVGTHEPSGKPVWMAAIADLYPRILENQATLIKKGAQKTATSVRGAERGSTPWDSHQLKNPARRECTPLG